MANGEESSEVSACSLVPLTIQLFYIRHHITSLQHQLSRPLWDTNTEQHMIIIGAASQLPLTVNVKEKCVFNY